MSWFYCRKPLCWELFRNESIESQNRSAAVRKSDSLANERRAPDNGLWWDAQRHVDQIVPAEFVDPKEIDTGRYRYQVFARPPPIPCHNNYLNDVTDTPLPVRYNIRRIAEDKPFPTTSFQCPQPKEQTNATTVKENSLYDCSENNSAQDSYCSVKAAKKTFVKKKMVPLPFSSNYNKSILCRDYKIPDEDESLSKNNNSKDESEVNKEKSLVFKETALATDTEGKNVQELVFLPQDKNNSRALECFSVCSDKTKTKACCKSGLKKAKHQWINEPEICILDNPGNKHTPQKNVTPVSVAFDVATRARNSVFSLPLSKSFASASLGNCVLPQARSTNRRNPGNGDSKHSHKVKPNRPQSSTAKKRISAISSRSGRLNSACGQPVVAVQNSVDLLRKKKEIKSTITTLKKNSPITTSLGARSYDNGSNTSLGRRCMIPQSACSPSVSITPLSTDKTWLTAQNSSINTSIQTPLKSVTPLRSVNQGQGNQGHVMFTEQQRALGCPETLLFRCQQKPPRKQTALKKSEYQSKLLQLQPSIKRVNSQLVDRSENNAASSNDALGVWSSEVDTFRELITPAFACAEIQPKIYPRSENIVFYLTPLSFCRDSSNTLMLAEEESTDLKGKRFFCSPPCTNNNAFVGYSKIPGKYTLQCFPIRSCDAEKYNPCDQRPEKMACRFIGNHLDMQGKKSVRLSLEPVRPPNPTPGKPADKKTSIPQLYDCNTVTSCATGKPVKTLAAGGNGDPGLVVCEPVRPTTPEIGYGTYKIVGSVQGRERPHPAQENLKLPPDLEEYREFTRRCPYYKRGRYDRSNPLNEMLLPSNKSCTLLGGIGPNPYVFCRIPKRKLPLLFEPLKVSNDLNWGLPAFVVNRT